ncbi:hypothetical protein K2X40_01760 [Candidatus Babeliales bacterium]|nr:hypothetical protein [Candidatus Babeliales bacterium]
MKKLSKITPFILTSLMLVGINTNLSGRAAAPQQNFGPVKPQTPWQHVKQIFGGQAPRPFQQSAPTSQPAARPTSAPVPTKPSFMQKITSGVKGTFGFGPKSSYGTPEKVGDQTRSSKPEYIQQMTGGKTAQKGLITTDQYQGASAYTIPAVHPRPQTFDPATYAQPQITHPTPTTNRPLPATTLAPENWQPARQPAPSVIPTQPARPPLPPALQTRPTQVPGVTRNPMDPKFDLKAFQESQAASAAKMRAERATAAQAAADKAAARPGLQTTPGGRLLPPPTLTTPGIQPSMTKTEPAPKAGLTFTKPTSSPGQQMLGAARIPAQPLPTLAPPPSLPTFSQETKPLPLSGPSIPARNRDDATANAPTRAPAPSTYTVDPELARKLQTLPPPLPPR